MVAEQYTSGVTRWNSRTKWCKVEFIVPVMHQTLLLLLHQSLGMGNQSVIVKTLGRTQGATGSQGATAAQGAAGNAQVFRVLLVW